MSTATEAERALDRMVGDFELADIEVDDGNEDVAVAGEPHTGAMIALVPSAEDAERLAVDGGEDVDQLHVTLFYLGKAANFDQDARAQVVDRIHYRTRELPVLTVDAFAVALFNPEGLEPCVALQLSGEGLQEFHEAAHDAVSTLDDDTEDVLPDQHPVWIPHLTLAYTDDADLSYFTDRTGPVTFDRVRVAFGGDEFDIPLREEAPALPGAADEYVDDDSDEMMTAGFDPSQPRDSEGKWTDSPSAPSISYDDLTEENKDALADAWETHAARIFRKYDDVSEAPPGEVRDIVRVVKRDAGLDGLSDADAANALDEWADVGGVLDAVTQADANDDTGDDGSRYPSVPTDHSPPLRVNEPWTSADDTNWNDRQQDAAYVYTGADYEEINGYLEGHNTNVSAKNKQVIDELRGMMRPAARDFTAFRGVVLDALGKDVTHDNIAEKLVGRDLTNGGFTSTSIKSQIVNKRYVSEVLMQVEVPKGAPVLYVGDMTANEEDDFELVLDANTRYRVVSATRTGDNQTVLRVQVI